MVKEVRTNRDYSDRTIQTARWAREQIKRQTGKIYPHFIERPLPYHHPQQHYHRPYPHTNGVNGVSGYADRAPRVHPWYPAPVEDEGAGEEWDDERLRDFE
jgi:hypothetical protein